MDEKYRKFLEKRSNILQITEKPEDQRQGVQEPIKDNQSDGNQEPQKYKTFAKSCEFFERRLENEGVLSSLP